MTDVDVDVDVAVVGAGFAGLGMALALQNAQHESFAVLERADDVGGTWRENTYPGIACDVPAHLYHFSDHPRASWSHTYAPGTEIQEYLGDVVRARGLSPRIRLNTPLRRARWTGGAWRIETGGADAGTLRAQSLVLACGRLTQPRLPGVPGIAAFPGPVVHTARWDHTMPLAGRRIAVVGTGASAVQLVPELVRRGASVTLFQRTPAWIMPRGGAAVGADEQRRLAEDPQALARVREHLFDEGEARFASRSGDAEASASARGAALAHLQHQVPDGALRDALTPRYPFGCKRVLLSDDFYPALSSGAVALEPSALVGVEGHTLIAASGAAYEADALVLATGFETTRQPYADLVEGERGLTLAEHWADGMTSLGSTVVSGFPDLYVLNGPNASLGHNSAVLMAEEQAAFVVRCLDERRSSPRRVRAEAERAYTREIVARSAGTPWLASGCRNWYVDERSGRLTLLWPGTVAAFRDRLARIGPDDFESDGFDPAPAGLLEGAT
ncbi:NAD(P)/FAD-dependent oxidoreductase [Microbacterium sp. LRZ72]|uniref:flavin-containing monooxygenase n=1 Tax=Microbacterium sp. LRZ72 TaxID=2942481 RepID=UPI0029B8499D|nr:NAD(P)/FAD-dependent oxidoreductase [Microbacterium sp. LRZ72]MDX2376422.1 NAD(P)/FAD-dependent oxidoreductase [Microbacterium sp. LRZ72]